MNRACRFAVTLWFVGTRLSWAIDFADPSLSCKGHDIVRGKLGRQVLEKLYDLEGTRGRIFRGFDLLVDLTQKLHLSGNDHTETELSFESIHLAVSVQPELLRQPQAKGLAIGLAFLRVTHQELMELAQPEMEALSNWMRVEVLPQIENLDQRKIIAGDLRDFATFRGQVLQAKRTSVIEQRKRNLTQLTQIETDLAIESVADRRKHLVTQCSHWKTLIMWDDRQIDYVDSELGKLESIDKILLELGAPF